MMYADANSSYYVFWICIEQWGIVEIRYDSKKKREKGIEDLLPWYDVAQSVVKIKH